MSGLLFALSQVISSSKQEVCVGLIVIVAYPFEVEMVTGSSSF